MALTITSPALDNRGVIAPRYTCDGENVSPGIAWEGVPEGTRSLIVIMEDRDIPMPWLRLFTWIHWIVYNIPPDLQSLPEAIPVGATPAEGTLAGATPAGATPAAGRARTSSSLPTSPLHGQQETRQRVARRTGRHGARPTRPFRCC